MKTSTSLLLLLLLFYSINLSAQISKTSSYGIGEKHTIYSKILNEDRDLLIYVPKGFWGLDKKLESYPIIYVLDGESQFLQTVSAVDFLSAAPLGNDLMPRSIVVGIPNTNRNRDLTPQKGMIMNDSSSLEITGGGVKFLSFITEEVSTYIDSLYSVNQHRTIIGHSLGGLMVFEALLNERDYFTNYLAIDPAVNYDNESYFSRVLDTLRNADLSQENLYIAKANSFPTFLAIESIENDTSEVSIITKTNKKFLQYANSEDWNTNYSFQDFPDENHFSIPYLATVQGLKFFYYFYPFPLMMDYYHPSYKEKTDLVEQLELHFQLISKKMGYKIIPMESYLNSWGHGLAYFGRSDLAMDLFDYNISLYPDQPTAYNTKGFFLISQGMKKEAIPLFEKSLSLKEDADILEALKEIRD